MTVKRDAPQLPVERQGRVGTNDPSTTFALGSLLASCLILLVAGCATHTDRVREARQAFFQGDLEAAVTRLRTEIERDGDDRNALELDLAVAELFSGESASAERRFRDVRDRLDYLEQKDVREGIASYLTDDTRLPYTGEDYEKVMLRAMLAATNLLNGGGDVRAYCLQVNEKQNEILQRQNSATTAPIALSRVAFGAYLDGIVREASHANQDDVHQSFTKVASWQPNYPYLQADLMRARLGTHSAPGHGALHVIAFVGQGPRKEEAVAVPTSQMLLMADQMISAFSDHAVPPTIAPVKVPKLVPGYSGAHGVRVAVNGQAAGITATITDVSQIALDQFDAQFPHIVARSVARRVVKKGTIYAAKDALAVSNDWSSLLLDAAGVAWEAAETADTRCWSFLPDKIQVLRIELPVGQHRVSLQPQFGLHHSAITESTSVNIRDGQNSYCIAYFPTQRIAGKILVAE